mgnify:CR=1 FL=1|jgi:hypothetical protein
MADRETELPWGSWGGSVSMVVPWVEVVQLVGHRLAEVVLTSSFLVAHSKKPLIRQIWSFHRVKVR